MPDRSAPNRRADPADTHIVPASPSEQRGRTGELITETLGNDIADMSIAPRIE